MAATTKLNGAELTLDPSGAVWWPEHSTLVIADLHLEKGLDFTNGERLLKHDGARSTIKRLAVVLRRYRPRRVVALGEGYREDPGAIEASDLALLARLIAEREWLWIAANHEAQAPPAPGGTPRPELALGPLVFRHRPAEGHVTGEVCGHLHPKAAVRQRGRRISGRCFVTDGARLIVPAFGAYTGGLDALDPAIAKLFAGQVRVYLIGRDTIYLFAGERLEGARQTAPAGFAR